MKSESTSAEKELAVPGSGGSLPGISQGGGVGLGMEVHRYVYAWGGMGGLMHRYV